MLRRVGLSALRIRRQTAAAVDLAQLLQTNASSTSVRSTAFSGDDASLSPIFSLDLGTQEAAFRFIDALARQGIGIVNNFGSTRTTVIHPRTTTQSSLSAEQQAEQGISPGLVRVSIGLESVSFLGKVFNGALKPHDRSRSRKPGLQL